LDTAFSTKETADFSVIQTWGIFNLFDEDEDTGDEYIVPNLILLGSVKERLEYPDLRRIAKEEYLRYRPDFCVVEKKASGQSLIQDLRRSGLPVLEYSPDRDKLSRVHTASPMLESGKVWLPKGKDWARDLFDEAIMFPYGAHDDQVDAMTMAIHYVKDSWRLEHPDDPEWEDEPRRKSRVGYWRV
jgi:predicted phage terminase large subunit-like protein